MRCLTVVVVPVIPSASAYRVFTAVRVVDVVLSECFFGAFSDVGDKSHLIACINDVSLAADDCGVGDLGDFILDEDRDGFVEEDIL